MTIAKRKGDDKLLGTATGMVIAILPMKKPPGRRKFIHENGIIHSALVQHTCK